MKIIQANKLKLQTKIITCNKCGSIFEVDKSECSHTSKMGVVHDGLGSYNIDCPVCGKTQYFSWKKS